MRMALNEARKALGRTSPNPCVGAVLVKDDVVVATGYHERAGTPHAEVHALRKAGDHARGATMFVTLEPCNHSGRTGPCSHAVVASGVRRVVIGMLDPNPLVAGGGERYLLDHDVEVTSGVLEDECRALNPAFIRYITSGRPLVALKAGISLDGRLNYQKGLGGSITGAASLARVHQLRDSYDAILVGRATAEIDNPSLTTRLGGGGRDPVRVILDGTLALEETARVFHLQSEAVTWVFCKHSADHIKASTLRALGVTVTPVACDESGAMDLEIVLGELARQDIISVLVEGGGRVHSSFLRQRLADRVHLFYAPIFAGSGGEGVVSNLAVDGRESAIRLINTSWNRCGEDMLVEGEICYPAAG